MLCTAQADLIQEAIHATGAGRPEWPAKRPLAAAARAAALIRLAMVRADIAKIRSSGCAPVGRMRSRQVVVAGVR